MKLGETDSADKFMVFGRGVLLVCSYWNNEKRSYELQIGQPQVIIKEIDGKKCEPIEELTIDLPENLSGRAVEFVTIRKGEMLSMEGKGAYDNKIQYSIVELSDCVINCLLLQLETIMSHRYIGYEPFKVQFWT
jgi:GTP-binding protein